MPSARLHSGQPVDWAFARRPTAHTIRLMTATPPGTRTSPWRGSASLLLGIVLTLPACGAGRAALPEPWAAEVRSRLALEWIRTADAPPEFRRQLADSPIAFFRFVNRPWTRAVCDAFADEARQLPTARLHGDAHVEQYAVTSTARGLDDFDDSARGPAVVDMVRFIGSLELVAAQRGWQASLPQAIDAFFSGYRQALDLPAYLPPDPAVVRRLRAEPVKSQQEFLAWADSLMEAVDPEDLGRLEISWRTVEAFAVRVDPEFTPAFLRRTKVGWLRMGIGSALTRKLLIRVEGPSPAPEDDLVLEAKEMAAVDRDSCVSIPPSSEAFRVIEGMQQIGRFDQRLVVAMPQPVGVPREGAGWWVRGWDRSYREFQVADLKFPDDLRELAHDVGAQLGATNLFDPAGPYTSETRLAEGRAMTRLEARIRRVAHDLTAELLSAWEHGRPK